MPDEKDKPDNGWSMPEPVFRTSEGRDVKSDALDPEADIPTETADRDVITEASVVIGSQTVRARPNRRIRHKNKRRKSFWEVNAKGLIVLGVLLLGLIVYLIYLYLGKII